jgi:hypothetical protein
MVDVRELYVGLVSRGYICDPPFVAKVAAALGSRPQAGAFLSGGPGTGKTLLPEVVARVTGAELVFQQCFPGTREEDLMVRMVPDDAARSGIRAVDGVIPEAMEHLRAGLSVVLCLDEWDKTRPSADAFLLDFLQKGRVRYAGRLIGLTEDERRRLAVFVTMNDERDLSEVLLRRLSKIDFELLPSTVVRQAMLLTHPGHPLIDACVTLYRRCMAARLPKPCTIQELRQVIDAADLLGRYADWDALVYQFVTKTPEQHSLLIAAESIALPDEKSNRPELRVAAYGMAALPAAVAHRQPKLPPLAEARGWGRATGEAGEVDTAKAGGIVAATDAAYDALLDWAGPPQPDPASIGGAGHVSGEVIIVGRTLPLARHADMAKLWGETGEIAFTAAAATFGEVMALRDSGWKVVSYAADRLVAKADGMMLSWTREEGVEMIVALDAKAAFDIFLNGTCPPGWLAEACEPTPIRKTRRQRSAA